MKPSPVEAGRSPHWRTVRKLHLKLYPRCAACGRRRLLLWRQIDVHHIVPFHIDRSLELDPYNLLTLCRGLGLNRVSDHLVVGHHGDWSASNPDVVADAARMLATAKGTP
jgi:hypothetical protein